MKTKNLCIAFIFALLAFQACTTDDVTLTEEQGPGDGTYAIKDNAFGEYLKYLSVTGVYSKVTNVEGTPVITYVIDTTESKKYTGDINLSKTAASIEKLQKAGLTTAADKIQDIDGIQFFTGLNSLALTSNNITALDLTTLVNLTELKMNFNKVGTLDLTHNTKLVTLNYRGSGEAEDGQKLKSINLSKNTELTTLDLQVHELTTIDLSKNTKLKSVNLLSNPGVPFTIPQDIYNNLTSAEGVEGGNPVPPVDGDYFTIPNKAFGEYLNYRLQGTDIVKAEAGTYKINMEKAAAYTGALNLSKNGTIPTDLETAGLETAKTKLTNLDGIQYFTGLTSLELVTNEIPAIDLSTLVNLITLNLNNNWMGTLDVTKNTKLETLSYNGSTKTGAQQLTIIDLTKNTELKSLSLTKQKLTIIDLSKNTKLTEVDLTGNPGVPFQIPEEIFKNLTIHEGVEVGNPSQGELFTISDLALGEYLNYRLQGLGIITEDNGTYKLDTEKAADYTGELDLRKRSADMTTLEGAGLATAKTPITNASGIEYFTGVTILRLVSNSLTSLDLTKLVNLTELDINNNLIGSLDLTKNTKLSVFSYNASSKSTESQKLSGIDLSKNTALTSLTVKSHNLTAVDLTNNDKLTDIDLSSNKNSITIPTSLYDKIQAAGGTLKGVNK